MSRIGWLLVVMALWVVFPWGRTTAVAQDDALDPARVLASIDRAVGYLKRTQTPRGAWDDPTSYPGGVTALATLALLNAGLDSSDPSVAKGVEFLRRLETEPKTYTVALRVMVLSLAQPRRDRLRIQRDVQWLEKTQIQKGKHAGGWGYGEDRRSGDPSNSQFAVLALFEAQQVGAQVQESTWRLAARYWRELQNDDGSWSYPGEPPSGSMTCAGVGALLITSLAGKGGDAQVEADAIRCCLPHEEDEAIDRGLAWLGRNFSIRRNPGLRRWHYYYLYALERVGRLSAHRFIGQHDWYREGTAHLVRTQDPLSHTWRGAEIEGSYEQITTSFALLFLTKGRRPIVMAKLRYGDEASDAWTRHRHDAAHLVHEAQQAWQLPMTWQVIAIERASVDDLLQAPVLYVSGSEVEPLLPHAKKLRSYLDRGGFLFAEACCDGDASSREAFASLVEAIFPEPEYGLRQVAASHPLWRMEQLVRPDSAYVGHLWAVDYGCRTSVVFCDRDLSCLWELDAPPQRDTYSEGVQQKIGDARTVGLNVLAYATNREPRGKEQQFVERLSALEVEQGNRRGVIEVAKLRHTGGCNDAPGALANLLRTAAEGELRLRLAPEAREVEVEDPALRRFHFAFMHGRNDFRLSRTARLELKTYLENGGTLLADAICSSKEFAKAFRRELRSTFDGQPMERLAAEDALLSDRFGGYDLRRVALREPLQAAEDQPLGARVRTTAPQLEGLRLGGRWAVLFSPYDLSCALERHEAIECRGYRREDAMRIGLNVLLYSINQ